MAYSQYINTDRIEQFDLSSYRFVRQWIEGNGEVLHCQDHYVELLSNDLDTGGVICGCETCGFREEWTPA